MDILLVEDNPDDVLLTELAVKGCNINGHFEVINNGKTAIELLDNLTYEGQKLPDLILLDINLPKITGLEVLKHIKSKPLTSPIPTVIFTSSDSVADMKYSYEEGADLYVKKPNNINDFKGIMHYIKNKLV